MALFSLLNTPRGAKASVYKNAAHDPKYFKAQKSLEGQALGQDKRAFSDKRDYGLGFNVVKPTVVAAKPTHNGRTVKTHSIIDAPAIRPAPRVKPIARNSPTPATGSKIKAALKANAGNNERLAKKRMIKASRKG